MIEPNFFKKLSRNARNILRASFDVAQKSGSNTVDPRHLLTAILLEKNALGAIILEQLGIRIEDIVSLKTPNRPILQRHNSAREIPFSEKTRDIIASAFLLAHRFSYPYVGSEHLVHALIEAGDNDIFSLFHVQKISGSRERASSSPLSGTPFHLPNFPDLAHILEFPENGFFRGKTGKTSSTPTLDEYGIRLGKQSSPKSFLARSKEIESVFRTLGRKTKSNPLLLGEPGVGKTTIVEAVAERCLKGEAGYAFHGTEIVLLDLSALVAGTSFRGEFEARLKEIVREVREHPHIILFLDEIHTLVGAGNASGALDAANILKPALSRGDIRCIGATTFAEYKRHIEKDPALERRFQPIRITEPTTEAALQILEESHKEYEAHHGITINQEALRAAVTMSVRHIPARFLPDKAFDLLDEAASLLKRRAGKKDISRKRRSLSLAYEEISTLKNRLVTEQKFKEAEAAHREETLIKKKLHALIKRESKREKVERPILSAEGIAEALSLMTETPIEKILGKKSDTLTTLFTHLSHTILGQDEAITALTRGIIRSQLGMEGGHSRPTRSILFLGPSGVGKTFTAKSLAEFLFGSRDSFLRFDMSEFRERHHMAQMIGSPAGYVGYGEGGKLTEHIRHHPASVILFDEIEKAHPDVLNLLLQILEEGILTDAEGRKARFHESVIILTSNIGTESFQKKTRFGFGGNTVPTFESLREEALRELEQSIRPELLARLDQTIVFRPLEKEALTTIARRELERLAATLKKQAILLRYSPELAPFLGEKSFAESSGARAVRRVMAAHIEEPIAETLLTGNSTHKKISLSLAPSKEAVTLTVKA
jgi:ATP-dependent Clp protease ATP-binding subunit ClpC